MVGIAGVSGVLGTDGRCGVGGQGLQGHHGNQGQKHSVFFKSSETISGLFQFFILINLLII